MIFSALILVSLLPFNLLFSPQSQAFYAPTFSPISFPKPSITTFLTPSPKPTRKPLPSVTPTSTPTPVPIAKPIPTSISVPVQTPVPTIKPTSTPVSPPASSSFIDQINSYRRSQGLSSVQSDPNTCSFAKKRAQEIVNNFNHDGFTNRINSKSLPYPSYHLVTENIAMNSNPAAVVSQWINSPGHAANMRASTPYVCVERSGNYYAYEGWKP